MKRLKAIIAFLIILFVLTFISAPAMAVEQIFPSKSHQGDIGKSNRIWKNGYFDNLIGDGTNANLYGFKDVTVVKSAAYSLLVADSGKVFTFWDQTSTNSVFLLPVWQAGLRYTFIVSQDTSMLILPRYVDRIIGLTSTNGRVIFNSTTGDTVTLVAVAPSAWAVKSYRGTWMVTSDTALNTW